MTGVLNLIIAQTVILEFIVKTQRHIAIPKKLFTCMIYFTFSIHNSFYHFLLLFITNIDSQ